MTKKKHPTALAALIEDSGLSYGDVEKLAFVKAPDLKGAGRETIRRYATGQIPEDAWNFDVVLAIAIATGWEIDAISPLALERLRHRRDLLVERIVWNPGTPGELARAA